MSNFRLVCLLHCFSKIYESYIEERLVCSMSNYISMFVSACRKGYDSQHVLIRLLQKWRQHLDNNNLDNSSRWHFNGFVKKRLVASHTIF